MALEDLVKTYNIDVRTEAYTKLVSGVLITAFATLGVFGISWFVIAVFFGSKWALAIAVLITLIYMGFSIHAAGKNIDPMDKLCMDDIGPTFSPLLAYAIGGPAGLMLASLQRHSIAGWASFLIVGPKSLLEGWYARKRTLAFDGVIEFEVMELLVKAKGGIEFDRAPSMRAVYLARILGLVKTRKDEDDQIVVQTTESGKLLGLPLPAELRAK